MTVQTQKPKIPYLTYILIGLNVGLFLFMTVNPLRLPWEDFALQPTSLQEKPWTFVSSAFMHSGMIHIAMNMFCLFMLGRLIETLDGKLKFLLVYFLSMIGANIAILLFSDPMTYTVGASGAIFGLLGYFYSSHKGHFMDAVITIGLNLWITFSIPNISWQAHVGGLVIGILLGLSTALVRKLGTKNNYALSEPTSSNIIRN